MHPAPLAVVAAVTVLLGACSNGGDVEGPSTGEPLEVSASLACDVGATPDAPYRTVTELTALVVGRWARCDGPPQLQDEALGVELTGGRDIFPLRRSPDGTVERLAPVPGVGPESWSVLPGDDGLPRLVFLWASSPSKTKSSFVIEGPRFFDGGQVMFFPYTPAGATYVRL